MKNVSNKEQFLKFQNQTSSWLNSSGALESQLTQRMIKATRRSASVFSSNLYGENNRVLCQSEPQLNALMSRGGVSVMRASDLSSLLAGSGSCASACGGSSCGNDDFDWKDMALMQMLPGLAQVAIAGIAKLFGIDMGGSAQATQAGGAQQGSGIFPTNAQNGGAQQGGGVNGGGYTSAPLTPTTTTTTTTTTTPSPSPTTTAIPEADDSNAATAAAGTTDSADKVIDTYKKDKDKDIKPVQKERNALGGQIEAKKADISDIDKDMVELDKGIKDEDKDKLNGLNAAVNKQNDVVTEKEKAVNAQNGRITDLKGQLPELRNDVENAEEALKSLKAPQQPANYGSNTEAAAQYDAEMAEYDKKKAELEADLERAKETLKEKEREIEQEELQLKHFKEDLQEAKDNLQKAEKALVDKKNELDKANKEKRDKLQAEKTKLQDELEKLEAKHKELEAIIAQHEAQEKGKKNTETDSFENGNWTGSTLFDGTKITRRGDDNVVLRNGDPVSTTIFANGPEYDRGSEYKPDDADKDRLQAKYGSIEEIDWKNVTNVRPKKDDSCVVTMQGGKQYYIHKQGNKYIKEDFKQ